MAYKIVVDAGHGGKDPGAVYGERYEKDDTLRLALKVGAFLKHGGMDVVYTRTTDIYQTPLQKAQFANREHADFFLSLHRNSSPRPNQYHGVETFIYNFKGIKVKMAENIDDALEGVGFKNLGVEARPKLIVLRKTRMPALLVEVGFLNSEIDNHLFETEFVEIAWAISAAILRTLGLKSERK